MAVKHVGILIKEARTAKKLSQEALAKLAGNGLSGSDIGKAERGEKALTQAQLKAIAKATGVTQKSLLEAPQSGGTAKTASSAKKTTTTAKKTTTAAKKPASTTEKKTTASAAKKTSSAAKTTTAAKKTSSTAKKPGDLTAAEQKMLELYREASSDNKKLAARILKGEKLEIGDVLPILMQNSGGGDDGLLGSLMGKLQGLMK